MSRAAANGAEHALDVLFGADRVGGLAFDPTQDQFSFVYSASWRQLGHRFPLSPHFPLDGEASAVAVRRFIGPGVYGG